MRARSVCVGSDVERWSDRFRLQDLQQRQLFDEASLATREFPPELSEMTERQFNRRRKLVGLKTKLEGGGAASNPASLSEMFKQLEKVEAASSADDVHTFFVGDCCCCFARCTILTLH